jgi:ceramide glucosyltransferase
MLWISFLGLAVIGTWTLFRQLKLPPRNFDRNKVIGVDGISILKPLKGADANLSDNLESFFAIKTSIPYELLFSIETNADPAFAILQALLAKYPTAPARVFILEALGIRTELGKNPKLRNIHASYEAARFDAVLISDSNVKLKAGELEALAAELGPKTGIVTAIVSGVSFRGLGGALESVFLGTFYARYMALSNRFAKPCVVGKAMLFRKSESARFGGLKHLSEFLAEDFMAGESMRKLGLQVKTSSVPVSQILGKYSFQTFWLRHVRWGRIRKSHAPLAFFAEPLFSPLSMSLLGTVSGALVFHISFLAVFFASWAFLCVLDGLCYLRSTRSSFGFMLAFPLIWTLRESLALPLWIKIASGNDIDWRGNRFTLAPGGLLGDK